jgi:trehalose 6-phosphate phosphatase
MSGHTRWVSAALLPDALAPLRDDPARAAVLLDIDGTLAPIVDRAADAHVSEPTRQLVIEVAKKYGLVACVTGRRASEARAMVSVGTITYLGSHGAEVLRPGWLEPALDPGVKAWVDPIAAFGRDLDHAEMRRRRVRIEDKGPILAFHWRGAPDQKAARETVEAIATEAENAGLRPHWGRKVLEVRPPVSFDKGSGVASLIRDADVDAALYVGDDRTDIDAFRAVAELAESGTISRAVRVGVRSDEGPTELAQETDFLVDGTDGVRQLLETLVAV